MAMYNSGCIGNVTQQFSMQGIDSTVKGVSFVDDFMHETVNHTPHSNYCI